MKTHNGRFINIAKHLTFCFLNLDFIFPWIGNTLAYTSYRLESKIGMTSKLHNKELKMKITIGNYIFYIKIKQTQKQNRKSMRCSNHRTQLLYTQKFMFVLHWLIMRHKILKHWDNLVLVFLFNINSNCSVILQYM